MSHWNAARPTIDCASAAGRIANELALRCHRLWGYGNSESFVGSHNTAESSHHLDCQPLLIRRWTGNGVASFLAVKRIACSTAAEAATYRSPRLDLNGSTLPSVGNLFPKLLFQTRGVRTTSRVRLSAEGRTT